MTAQTGADAEFLGYRAGEALFDVTRGARATALPSEGYENTPMRVMESYALDRPVIGAATGGIPELVPAGETGEVFPSGDAEAFAARLIEFRQKSDEQVLAMGKTNRRRVEQDFAAARYRELLLHVYHSMGVDC